jgi:2'-5' RNA ligase
MRLFVAITPPAEALEEMEALAAPLRAAWPRLRWTGPAEWHVTLAFLGEVDAGVLPGLGTRLERAARRHPVLQLSVTGAGTFPGARRARVLWAGIRGDRKERAAPAPRRPMRAGGITPISPWPAAGSPRISARWLTLWGTWPESAGPRPRST